MQRNGTKKGFTLIELIVVLAILAIIAAIAIPTAFSSLEKARDKAARASVHNMLGIAKSGAALAQLDEKLVESVKSVPGAPKQVVLNIVGIKGVFKARDPGIAMAVFLEKYLNDSAIQMADKAQVTLGFAFDTKGMLLLVTEVYFPTGEGTQPSYYYNELGKIERYPELK